MVNTSVRIDGHADHMSKKRDIQIQLWVTNKNNSKNQLTNISWG